MTKWIADPFRIVHFHCNHNNKLTIFDILRQTEQMHPLNKKNKKITNSRLHPRWANQDTDIAAAFVSSQIDYTNSVLYISPSKCLRGLQHVQSCNDCIIATMSISMRLHFSNFTGFPSSGDYSLSLSTETVDFRSLRFFKRTMKLADFSSFLKCF